MMGFREYRVLKALDNLSVERRECKYAAKTESDEIIVVGISDLQKRLHKYSKDRLYTTLLLLDSRGLIKAGYSNPQSENVILASMKKEGRVAIEDYPKDLVFSFIRNFVIPIIAAAFFSALFTKIFT